MMSSAVATTTAAVPDAPAAPMLPRPFVVERVIRDGADTTTVVARPAPGGAPLAFQPGQFTMLSVFGVGEVPISISGDPAAPDRLIHTVRAVGAVSAAIARLSAGAVVGVRGPFGRPWPMDTIAGQDVVVVAGGLGLAPLRALIYTVLANRGQYGRFLILYGARTHRDILYRRQMERWSARLDTEVAVTVDRASAAWHGSVGVVTRLIDRGGIEPKRTQVLVCGPETMIRFSVRSLQGQGVDPERIWVSMERNMHCALGFCGHCQLGGHFVCRDGPVFRLDEIQSAFAVREL